MKTQPHEVLDLVRNSSRILITTPLLPETLEAVKQASRQFPDRVLCVADSAFEGSLEDLAGFEHLQGLEIRLFEATSFDVLGGFHELRTLVIEPTRSAKPSLAVLAHCPNIEELEVDGHAKGLDSLATLRHLRLLRLLRSRTKTLDFLTDHPSLERMELLYSSVRDLSPLKTTPLLTRLMLERVRGLTAKDLGTLAGKPFQLLGLESMPHVEDLEALGPAPIEHLSLDNVRNLRTLVSLRQWPELAMLGLRDANPRDGSLVEVMRNPALQHVAITATLSTDELAALRSTFTGESFWYRGGYVIGTDQPRNTIASRLDV